MSNFPDPPYFHVSDLERRWNQTKATIESFINTGDLKSVPELAVTQGCREIVIYVSEADLQDREPNPEEELEVQNFTVRDGVLHVRADDYFVGNMTPAQAEQRALDLKEADLHRDYKMDPVVLLADVLAFEKQHGIKTKTPPVRGIETLNTTDHPAYAPELAAAVHVWLNVYADMQDVEEVKALQGVKRERAYEKALKAVGYDGYVNHESKSDKYKLGTVVGDRLSSVVNPQATKR